MFAQRIWKATAGALAASAVGHLAVAILFLLALPEYSALVAQPLIWVSGLAGFLTVWSIVLLHRRDHAAYALMLACFIAGRGVHPERMTDAEFFLFMAASLALTLIKFSILGAAINRARQGESAA